MRLFYLLFLITSFPLLANTKITSEIHEIDFGNVPGDEVLVFLKSGDVARIRNWDQETISKLQQQKSLNGSFELTLDGDRFVTHVKRLENKAHVGTSLMSKIVPNEEHIPSTLPNKKIATDLIAEGRIPTKEQTQCFNRAMVWVYEWWKKHSLKTNKVFVFWSKEYVRKYSFKWWFHVSPYVHVKDETGAIKEMVLDVKWLRKPYEFQDWVDYHASKDIKCKVVSKYADYADYPFDEGCYFIRENMYFWQPADLEMRDAWGYSKNAFNMTEVKAAYLEAFDISL